MQRTQFTNSLMNRNKMWGFISVELEWCYLEKTKLYRCVECGKHTPMDHRRLARRHSHDPRTQVSSLFSVGPPVVPLYQIFEPGLV